MAKLTVESLKRLIKQVVKEQMDPSVPNTGASSGAKSFFRISDIRNGEILGAVVAGSRNEAAKIWAQQRAKPPHGWGVEVYGNVDIAAISPKVARDELSDLHKKKAGVSKTIDMYETALEEISEFD